MKDKPQPFLKFLNPPKEIVKIAEVSLSRIDGNEIAKIILGDSLLDECNLYKWHGDCEGCPFHMENYVDYGICKLRRMILQGNRINRSNE
jgi:hypothetical protein